MYKINSINIKHWIAYLFLVLNWFLMLKIPPFNEINFRWYDQLIISFLAYLLIQKKFSFKAIIKCKWIYYSYFMGILTMIIFNPSHSIVWDPDIYQLTPSTLIFQIYWSIKKIVAILTLTLFTTVLSNTMARKILFYCIIISSLIMLVIVNTYIDSGIESMVSLVAIDGQDKNSMSLLFNISIMLLFPYTINKKEPFYVKIISIALIILFAIGLISSVSRGGLFILFLSLVQVAVIHTIYYPLNINKIKTYISIGIIVAIAFSYTQSFIEEYPFAMSQWIEITTYYSGERDDVSGRINIVKSGLSYLSQNGLIIGHGFKSPAGITNAALGLPYNFHNSYLEFWATIGIFGLLSLIIFIKRIYHEIGYQMKRFVSDSRSNNELGFALIGLPVLLTLAFFDLGSVWFFISIYAGFEYERYLNKRNINSF